MSLLAPPDSFPVNVSRKRVDAYNQHFRDTEDKDSWTSSTYHRLNRGLCETVEYIMGPDEAYIDLVRSLTKKRRQRLARRSSKSKTHSSLARRLRRFTTKHTWSIPLAILLGFLSLYAANPSESSIVHRFIFLSYRQDGQDGTPVYGKGLWDLAFVSFYTVVLSFTRELIMQELLRPLAVFCGIKSRGKQCRFMEQMYTAIYFGIMGPAGLYVMSRTPVWYFNSRGMYEGYPHSTHDAYFKFYYLFQAAYWAQQGIVMALGLEKKRKDFKELLIHHIVTLSLIGLSYVFHFTYTGLAIYVTHDISDFFLAVSKSLHYISAPFTEVYFGTSIAIWIYARHYLNLYIIYSLFGDFKTVGPYELDWRAGKFKCPASNLLTAVLLSMLQALNLFWLYCLLRSAYNLLVYKIAKDDRSEVEESEVEQVQAKKGSSTQAETNSVNQNKLPNDGVATSRDVGVSLRQRPSAFAS